MSSIILISRYLTRTQIDHLAQLLCIYRISLISYFSKDCYCCGLLVQLVYQIFQITLVILCFTNMMILASSPNTFLNSFSRCIFTQNREVMQIIPRNHQNHMNFSTLCLVLLIFCLSTIVVGWNRMSCFVKLLNKTIKVCIIIKITSEILCKMDRRTD